MMNPFADIPSAKDLMASVRHIDHITYVDSLGREKEFIATWARLGFHEHVRVFTQRHPASHIALVAGSSPEYPWATMTGLSISEDENSPINESVRRYGPGVQHVAYNIDPRVEMAEVHERMTKHGWNFMTNVLTYQDDNKARLRQMFVAPSTPYGTFVEFIQRLPGSEGKAYDGFDINNIDGLYDHYIDYSKFLDRKKS